MNTLLSTTSPAAGFRALLRWSSLAVVGSLLAACSGGDPPTVCTGADAVELKSPVTLFTGEEDLVDYCFMDPEGAKLAVTTATTDENVGIALVYGKAVLVKAQGPGTATITITAEDPGGNTASVDFELQVPNQPPFVSGEWPKIKLLTEQTMELFVDDFFRDADRDALFFTAGPENDPVASVVLEDSLRIVITALSVGEIYAVLTARDPHGGTAELEGYIRVVEPVLFWRDDFDTNTFDFVYNFATWYSYLEKPGYLSAYNRYANYFISGFRTANDNAAEWMASMSVAANSSSSNQTLGFWSTVADPVGPLRWFIGTIGLATQYQYIYGAEMPANWQVWGCCPRGYAWIEGGMSDAVNGVGEFSEMHFGVQRGKMSMTVGETVVHSEDAKGKYPLINQQSRLFGYAGGGENGSNQMSYWDWAELWAIDAYDDAADQSGDWQFQDGASPLSPLPPAEIQRMNIVAQ